MSRKSLLIVLSFAAFISLGLPDGLLGVAWPGIRHDFSLPLDAMGLLLIFGTAGYTLSSFFSASLVERLGLGGLLSVSCSATAGALLLYTLTPIWAFFVAGAFIAGAGGGAIDAGINGYIAKNHSQRAMQWLHGSFGIGVTLGPLIMTAALDLTGRWRPGYRFVALAQLTLALIFLMTRKRWVRKAERDPASPLTDGRRLSQAESFRNPGVRLGMLMFLIYTGVELVLGLWGYTLLTESRGIGSREAGLITGSYWGMFTVGRFLAGLYNKRISGKTLLRLSMICAGVGVLAIIARVHALVTLGGIVVTGFSIAPIFPGLISDTEERTGADHRDNGIGMQIAAAGAGAALIPTLAGVLARRFGLESIPVYLLAGIILLFVCFELSHAHRTAVEES